MRPLNAVVLAATVGVFMAVTYTLCVIYGLAAPATLHRGSVLEAILPGFVWITPSSFVLGLVETLVYGLYAGALFALIYNLIARVSGGGIAR